MTRSFLNLNEIWKNSQTQYTEIFPVVRGKILPAIHYPYSYVSVAFRVGSHERSSSGWSFGWIWTIWLFAKPIYALSAWTLQKVRTSWAKTLGKDRFFINQKRRGPLWSLWCHKSWFCWERTFLIVLVESFCKGKNIRIQVLLLSDFQSSLLKNAQKVRGRSVELSWSIERWKTLDD